MSKSPHKYRFIFIKTAKTAGIRIQMALSRISGEKDVCALFKKRREGEETRLAANYRGIFLPKLYDNGSVYQNWRSEIQDALKLRKFRSHMTAEELFHNHPTGCSWTFGQARIKEMVGAGVRPKNPMRETNNADQALQQHIASAL